MYVICLRFRIGLERKKLKEGNIIKVNMYFVKMFTLCFLKEQNIISYYFLIIINLLINITIYILIYLIKLILLILKLKKKKNCIYIKCKKI